MYSLQNMRISVADCIMKFQCRRLLTEVNQIVYSVLKFLSIADYTLKSLGVVDNLLKFLNKQMQFLLHRSSAMGPLGHQPQQLHVTLNAPPAPLPPFPPYPPPPYSSPTPPPLLPPPPASSVTNHAPPTEHRPPTTDFVLPQVPVILEPPAEEEPDDPPLAQKAPRPPASAPLGRRNLEEAEGIEGNVPSPAVYNPPRSARF